MGAALALRRGLEGPQAQLSDDPALPEDRGSGRRRLAPDPTQATTGAGPTIAVDDLTFHYRTVIDELAEGRVIPLLGAGVNLCGRKPDAVWDRKTLEFLPSGGELAGFLAGRFQYPPQDVADLLRVSQWAAVKQGLGVLYDELRDIFNVDYEPSVLHHFLARLPAALKEKGCPHPYQLILTTNYDDALERAFRAAGEPFDLLSYIADGEDRGRFMHISPDGPARLVDRPNEATEPKVEQRTVIAKIHGAVDRDDDEADSYVITEDQYIEYLARTDISSALPVTLSAKLTRSAFLFLGYSMRDWNVRVILHRIWGQQKRRRNSWAVQAFPEDIEREFWQERKVQILEVMLDEYVRGLDAQLREPLGDGIIG